MARVDPFRNFRFRVEIDGILQAAFSDASGFDSTVEPIEYREGSDPTYVRKLTGLTKYGTLTLKRGVTDSMDIYNWHLEIMKGNIIRKNMSVIIMDEAGNDKARWNISNAWPTKYSINDLSAKGNDVAIETLEIVHEGVKRIK